MPKLIVDLEMRMDVLAMGASIALATARHALHIVGMHGQTVDRYHAQHAPTIMGLNVYPDRTDQENKQIQGCQQSFHRMAKINKNFGIDLDARHFFKTFHNFITFCQYLITRVALMSLDGDTRQLCRTESAGLAPISGCGCRHGPYAWAQVQRGVGEAPWSIR